MEIKNVYIINLSGKIKKEDLVKIKKDIDFIKNKFPQLNFHLLEHTFSNSDPNFLADALNKAIKDDKVDLIMVVKGGVRSIELINYININVELKNKKAILGNSDFCHIAPYLDKINNLEVFVGLNLKSFSKLDKDSVKRFEDIILKRKSLNIGKDEIEIYKGGSFYGKIIPENDIALLNITASNPKLINFKNKILVLENHSEKDYRMIKYWLYQYTIRGIFKKIKGLILGDFPLIEKGEEELLKEDIVNMFKEYTFPILRIRAFGEGEKKSPFRFHGVSEYNRKNFKIN